VNETPLELVFCDSKGKALVKHGPFFQRTEADHLIKDPPPGTKSWKLYKVVREEVASGVVTSRVPSSPVPPRPLLRTPSTP
jgi:hypothetical protein